MKKFVLIAVCCLFIKAQASVSDEAAEVKVIAVNNITDYIQSNPNATAIPMKRSRETQNLHRLGARLSGDRLVAKNCGSDQYPSKHDLELSICYPKSGDGAILTYVQISMIQDFETYGQAYVIDGGIGQRLIKIVVEAWNTAYLEYDYSLYGY
jgi:hypothetical protein